jgi:hypothetical protein
MPQNCRWAASTVESFFKDRNVGQVSHKSDQTNTVLKPEIHLGFVTFVKTKRKSR